MPPTAETVEVDAVRIGRQVRDQLSDRSAALPEGFADRLAELAILAHSRPVPEALVAAVWQATVGMTGDGADMLRRALAALELLRLGPPGTVVLDPVVRAAARSVSTTRQVVRLERMRATWHDGQVPGRAFEVAIDANEPEQLRRFWLAALDYVEQPTAEGAVDLVDPAGQGPTIWFQQVSERKTGKNRLHLDLFVSAAERAGLVEQLTALGGSVISDHPRFTVMADPEGNEFCLTES